MLGGNLGYTLQNPWPLSSGGGGGGETYFSDRVELVQTVAFSPGLTINLPNTPFDPDNLQLFYNGVKVRPGSGGFTLSSNIITVDFSDDPTLYDSGNVVFEVYYLYT